MASSFFIFFITFSFLSTCTASHFHHLLHFRFLFMNTFANALKMRASPEPGLSETYIIPIARELAEALKWVHNAGIIHRDVKG
jgi:serine/threonine protein kinase